jgi:hypothetical protein
MEPVLELITSYENRIATVEELMTTAYQATVTSGGRFDILDEERERLKTGLQKMLARNCSLRKKDFNRLLERILSDSDKNKEAIVEERRRVSEKVQEYLDKQKQLANCLRQQVVALARDKTGKSGLDTIIRNIKATYADKGQHFFSILRDFQIHLEAFQKEQAEINHKLQRLIERGESLSLEDLRQLEATKAHQDRKTDRELRREEVDRLLSRFRQHRLEIRRQ